MAPSKLAKLLVSTLVSFLTDWNRNAELSDFRVQPPANGPASWASADVAMKQAQAPITAIRRRGVKYETRFAMAQMLRIDVRDDCQEAIKIWLPKL